MTIPQRILLTGGAGFIGSCVARLLMARGCEVRLLDNLDPFYDRSIKRRNLTDLQSRNEARFEFQEGDIRDPDAAERAVEGMDAVVHLAALAGVRPSLAEPARYMDVNVTGTQVLLDALRRQGSSSVPFIYGSSSSVYGGNEKVPFAECDPVDHPVSPYAASKLAGELICHAFHRLYGNPVTSLRFFTVYGPGQRPEMAIHRFVHGIVQGEPIPFFGDGESRRDYTYVDDIAQGVSAAVDNARGYAIYNLGGATTTSLSELVAMLEQILERDAVLERLPDQPGDVSQTWANIGLAERDLGYRCNVPLSAGLRRFCDWYREAQEASP